MILSLTLRGVGSIPERVQLTPKRVLYDLWVTTVPFNAIRSKTRKRSVLYAKSAGKEISTPWSRTLGRMPSRYRVTPCFHQTQQSSRHRVVFRVEIWLDCREEEVPGRECTESHSVGRSISDDEADGITSRSQCSNILYAHHATPAYQETRWVLSCVYA